VAVFLERNSREPVNSSNQLTLLGITLGQKYPQGDNALFLMLNTFLSFKYCLETSKGFFLLRENFKKRVFFLSTTRKNRKKLTLLRHIMVNHKRPILPIWDLDRVLGYIFDWIKIFIDVCYLIFSSF
jgi:hypothetical protein